MDIAQQLSPLTPEASLHRAKLLAVKDPQKGLDALAKGLARAPSWWPLLWEKGRLLGRLKRVAQAREVFERALAGAPKCKRAQIQLEIMSLKK